MDPATGEAQPDKAQPDQAQPDQAQPDKAQPDKARPNKAPTKRALRQAAKHFDQGQKHYGAGRYAEAIKAFTEAHRLAPHHSALFNLARCYENLGDRARAIEHYRKALALATDPSKRADIEFRIRRLRSRPVKVFVSSRPSGAAVTVDGRASAEGQPTPAVVTLPPGEHVLLLRKEGHHLAARRIVVQMDRDLTVDVKLRPLPAPCAPAPPPCPEPLPCPETPTLTDLENLHIHTSVGGAFGFTTERPVASGPVIQIHGTFHRIVFGGHFTGFPMGEEQLSEHPAGKEITDSKATFRWLMGQVEGGYALPFRNWYAYATVGLGVSADRITFSGTRTNGEDERLVKEQAAFVWSIGGGADAMVTRWLSIGAAFRFGVIHGDRVDKSGVIDDQHHFPYGSLWGSIAFHL
jgi:hypothetical protein